MPTVSEISSRYIDEIAALDPVRGERWGVVSDSTRLTDYSPAGYAALRALLGRTLDDLAAAEPPSDEAERLGAGFLEDWVRGEAGVIDAGERERSLSIIVGPPASTRSVFDLMDRATPEAWGKIAARLRAVPGAMDGYRATLEAGLAAGRPAARRQAVAVAEQCATWAGGGDGGWFAGFVAGAAEVGISERLMAELEAAAREAGNAYGRLADWLRDEYAPLATETDASGDERYCVWARFLLGTDLNLDEAYAWGWEELARLEAAKAEECARILPGASFLEVRELLITDPARSIHGVDAYRDWLQATTDEAIEGLDGREFDIHPSIRRCNVRIPPEGSAAAAYYTPPSEDLARPGQTWFPTVGRTRFPTWDEVSTVYHEAVPGHHLQGAAIRLVPLTRAQKLGFVSAHGEGWALYAERLMDELGWFRTPETRLGFLCAHAFRAARVVADIGLHTGRAIPAPGAAMFPGWSGRPGEAWTYDGAIDFMVRAGGMERDKAESEVLRYLSWPSQATAYKLGERTWLAGREAARSAAAAEGRAFDLKTWHARALALGPLGLNRLGAELARI
ncbi:MAG TPA: DUF885 domain-containing protein [Candidatus Sulfomarinibacteraceae bacterium]|nr:DUF885 domain-containing protein [Candidatus Sulfomarinibacteraceae bacterium]